ncbi:major facilitator superfamily domain-containing protein [Halteromyces radiatus]|uniref:major facilitator superfamily domain-containing protein n=1 Tax=Halteromyces radiatus TaxID=101107 RepID=UPI00221F307B|nr:major facilitator superfamily domain-containing protein [Halteromyces radiatus]KAI8082925.1 major facilitator superfamily domain-containing protein [Halteromyces radiatus]
MDPEAKFENDKSSEEDKSQIGLISQPRVSNLRFALVFSGLILGFFMAALDQTIVITALGQISAEFNATNDIGWVGSSYLLTMSGFQPMYGIFADIIGHKIVYLIAITIFLIGSILCGLSTSMFMLIMSRAVQGIGGAGLITVVLIIVTDVVTVRDRAKYQGILGVALGTATVAGPLIGGAFADANLWRWSFFMNVFIGLAAIVIIVFFFRRDMYLHHRSSTLPLSVQLRRVDYGSLVLLMPGAICMLVALQTGGEQGSWSTPLVLILFSVGGFALVLFVLSEIFVIKHNPVLPRRLVTSVSSMAILIAQFAGSATDYAILYFVPLHYQIVRGDSAVQSALELLPFFLSAVIAGLISGILITKTGYYRIYLWSGCTFAMIGSALLATSTVDSNVVHQYVFLAILGLGVGLCKQSFVVAGQAASPEEDLSLATSHGQFFRVLGGAVGISISATLFRFNITRGLKDLMDKLHLHLTLRNINMIKALPRSVRIQVQTVAVQSLDKIYIFAAVASGTALLAVILVKHTDLWTKEDEEQDEKIHP